MHVFLLNVYALCILIVINFTGPSAPLQPSNVIYISVNSTIQWTVQWIAYTPETYTVHFGTSPGSLTPFNQQRQSGDNFTATNLSFSVQLTGLSAGTTYYYQVVTVNSVGSNQSDLQQFTTSELCKLQIVNVVSVIFEFAELFPSPHWSTTWLLVYPWSKEDDILLVFSCS